MKVLVTGGAGYIGSVASEMLLDQGHEVTIFDNLERGHREALDTRAHFILGDLRNRDQIRDAMAKQTDSGGPLPKCWWKRRAMRS